MSNEIYEDLSEQITLKLKPSMKLKLPTAFKDGDEIRFKKGKLAAKFIRKAIKMKLNGEGVERRKHASYDAMKAGLKEFNKLMSIVKPSTDIRSKININVIKKAMEVIK